MSIFSGQMPDVTQSQILAALKWIVAQSVAIGVVDGTRSQLILSIGSTVISSGWIIADSLLRGKRAIAQAIKEGGAVPTVKT